MEAAAMPFPSPEMTPPVTKIYLLIEPPRPELIPSDYILRAVRTQERRAVFF